MGTKPGHWCLLCPVPGTGLRREYQVLGTGQRLAASWERNVGAVVQVCKRKGKKEVRPKITTGAVRLSRWVGALGLVQS